MDLAAKKNSESIAAMLPMASGYWLPHICATETRNQQNHILAIATPLVFCA